MDWEQRRAYAEKQSLLSRSLSQSSEEWTSEVEFSDLDARSSSEQHPSTRPRWTKRRSSNDYYRDAPYRRHHYSNSWSSSHRRRRTLHFVVRSASWIPLLLITTLLLCGVFIPSYSHPPQRYRELRQRVRASGSAVGSANVHSEKVFIVASISDTHGSLVTGHWGNAVHELVNLLGPDNTFVSVFENDADEESTLALRNFGNLLACDSSVVAHKLDLDQLPHLTLPDGTEHIKRIALLAEVRNRALRPLDDPTSPAYRKRWDKILYLNDVAFDPLDAANLLFNTNVDYATGRAEYGAACAVDFINPFKVYDTYATRDLDGAEMGVPIFPWFTKAGNGQSRSDVLSQSDAVRVKSCWGGMIAFQGKWFQPHLYELRDGELVSPESDHQVPSGSSTQNQQLLPQPLRFRYEPDTYWDASECCLINADLAQLASNLTTPSPYTEETNIFMNPYIRVAYSPSVLRWLGFTRRFERLFAPIQSLANRIAGKPRFNPRQLHVTGEKVRDLVWQDDGDEHGGSFRKVVRTATPGGFCGLRQLSYVQSPARQDGKKWVTEKFPYLDDS